MDIFGMCIPLWILVAIYIVGMCVIGYPMGYYSLKVWKYPGGYSFARKLLFPLYGDDPKKDIGDASFIADVLGTKRALYKKDSLALTQYIFSSMLIWPISFAYIVCVLLVGLACKLIVFVFTDVICPVIHFFGWSVGGVTRLGAKVLLVTCKKCSQI